MRLGECAMVNTIPAELRPTPIPNDLTQPFWDAAKNRRLAIQRCQDCGRYFHPPLPICNNCYSTKLAFETVTGRGRIYSRTVMHDPRILGFGEAVVPYAVIAVELD